jgi:hypothetical protein
MEGCEVTGTGCWPRFGTASWGAIVDLEDARKTYRIRSFFGLLTATMSSEAAPC